MQVEYLVGLTAKYKHNSKDGLSVGKKEIYTLSQDSYTTTTTIQHTNIRIWGAACGILAMFPVDCSVNVKDRVGLRLLCLVWSPELKPRRTSE